MKTKHSMLAAGLCVIGVTCAALAIAQTAGLKRTMVEKADVSGENREAVVARVELDPGVMAGWHTHPGDEIGYVMEGEAELYIDGAPLRKLKTGDAFVIPAGKMHDAKNTGTSSLKLVGVYVVEKGKPLATPAKQ